MGNISQKIDSIIHSRKENLKKLEEMERRINDVKEAVSEFEQYQASLTDGMSTPDSDEIERLKNISTSEFGAAFEKYNKNKEHLKERLGRDSLHISFVGRAGQGKSLVMQNISGLNGKVIPSTDGSDCTGARSIITNSDNDKVYAEIEFFSEREMIDIVNRYLEKITQGHKRIGSLSEIKTVDTEKLKDELSIDKVEERSLLVQLKKYVDHYDDYTSNLGQKKEIAESEIEQYVAQYNSADHEEKYYKYLGVKLANIKCCFPHSDAGKIVLVDTIGIGDVSLGTEEEMLKTVRDDSDAIILMQRPDSQRSTVNINDNIKIVKKIKDEVSAEYTKEMLFWVINRVETERGNNIQGIPEVIRKIEDSELPIAKILNVNCYDKNDVEKNLLIPVLDQMAKRIQDVDMLLFKRLDNDGKALFNAYNTICDAAKHAFMDTVNDDLKHEFRAQIKDTYKTKVQNEIRKLCNNKYNNLRDLPCEELKREANIKLKNIFLSVPDKETIIKRLNQGDINRHNAYEKCTDEIRMKIINDFTSLNIVLSKIIEAMKQEVLDILTNEARGRLGYIYPSEGKTYSEWVKGFLDTVNAEKKYPLIYDSLMKFEEYTINVQGFFIYIVRDQLDSIDISLQQSSPTIRSSVDADIADEIIEILRSKVYYVHENIEKYTEEIYKIPNKSMFAAIKDLYDRLTYSSYKGSVLENAEDDWVYLYEDCLKLLWKDEYMQKYSLKEMADSINKAINSLAELNKIDNFQMIKN